MKSRIVATSNLKSLWDAADELTARGPGLPGLIVGWGETGRGKTYAALSLVQHADAIYVPALAFWSPVSMLQSIAHELGCPERGRCAPMIRDIVAALRSSSRPLLIDEADYVIREPKLIDGLRDIADLSSSVVVLLGMGTFKAGLTRFPQVSGRVARWVEFRGASPADARLLADELLEVGVADDLLERLHSESRGSMRKLALGLHQIEVLGRRRRVQVVSLAEWAERSFDFAEPPLPRRKIAEVAECEVPPRMAAVA